jgi:hypothetical protein
MSKKPDAEMLRRLRYRETRRLLRYRYGPILSDDGDGWRVLHELLLLVSLNSNSSAKTLVNVIETSAPWMESDEAEALIEDINRIPINERWRNPRQLGDRLRLTHAERERLKIKTILPHDLTDDELKERRKAKAKARMQKLRQKRGSRSRAEYLAANTATRNKPWLALGISRASWYRHRETSPCSINLTKAEHAPVSEKSETPKKKLAISQHRGSKRKSSSKPRERKRIRSSRSDDLTAKSATGTDLSHPVTQTDLRQSKKRTLH